MESFELELNGNTFEATRLNTSHYTHYGRVMLRGYEMDAKNFDHVFFQTEQREDRRVGGFLFRGHPAYKKVVRLIRELNYPQVLNQTCVANGDVVAWENETFKMPDSLEGLDELS